MARGVTFSDTYGSGPDIQDGGGNSTGIAAAILEANAVPFQNVQGSPLIGYDIKSQDCATMLKLSLLAQGFDGGGDGKFREVYVAPDGIAKTVIIGESTAAAPTKLILTTEVSSFVNKIDHVLVKGKDPLPIRRNGPTLSVMGAGRISDWGGMSCPIGYFTKAPSIGQEAWAAFETSPQHPDMQEQIKFMVRRSQWEQLVGYKVRLANIPPYASFSVSQTTPYTYNITLTSDLNDTVVTFSVSADPYEGAVIDISNVNIVGSPVLDVVDGKTLKDSFAAFINDANTPFFEFTEDDYYVLLDHQCGLQGLSRGDNWFVYPVGGSLDQASVFIRQSQAAKATWDIFNGAFNTVNYFRRKNGQIASISDMVKANVESGNEPLSTGLNGVAYSENMRGLIIPGLGGRWGIEAFNGHVAYSISKPSIQIRSPFGDAFSIAAAVAAAGVTYTAIIIVDKPAPTGWNGTLVYPPAPPDDEAEAFDPDSPIDELTGSIIDMSVPFLGEEGVQSFSGLIHSLINGDSGRYKSYNYAMGGYNLLPGMKFNDSEVIHTIEFNYADKDSVSTNITTGPLYYNVGSYGDSQYVKRSETISRNGRVLGGSNATGTFSVHVDGLGTYEALNSLIEPCYPGDRVEVKVLNVPVEK